jgi:hypothetical protein
MASPASPQIAPLKSCSGRSRMVFVVLSEVTDRTVIDKPAWKSVLYKFFEKVVANSTSGQAS